MKLWRISQTANGDYDTYDSAIVAAESEDEARLISPDEYHKWGERYSSWAPSPQDVSVAYIGEAVEGTPSGIVLASFNAG